MGLDALKQKVAPFLGEGEEGSHGDIDRVEDLLTGGGEQDDAADEQLKSYPPEHGPPFYGFTVCREQIGEPDHGGESEER